MRVFAVVPALSVVLAAVSSFAQTPPAPGPPTQTPPAAVQPAPEPFKEGMKYGYVNIQDVASLSVDGRAAAVKLNALRDKLQKDLAARQAAVEAAQKKFEAESGIRSDGGAQLRSDIERQQRDLTRMAQDADEEIEERTPQLQQEFMYKLRPAIDRVAREKQVDLIFNQQESGLVWAIPGTNLTADVIRALDAAAAPAPAPAAAPAPTAKPPAAPVR